jgi:hypothetical protein
VLVPAAPSDTGEANDALLHLLPGVLALWGIEDGGERVELGLEELRGGALGSVTSSHQPGWGLPTHWDLETRRLWWRHCVEGVSRCWTTSGIRGAL